MKNINSGKIPDNLPCYPCPHKSCCCRWGTWLTDEEGIKLNELYGDMVFLDEDTKVWRTQVRDGRCVFLNRKDIGCSIHHLDIYPQSCRDFPWKDARDPLAPRAFDAITCPEIPIE
jgi:Fe-S-cluster containining protein